MMCILRRVVLSLMLITFSGGAWASQILIGTGGPEGLYYPVGQQICWVINSNKLGLRCDVRSSMGSGHNLQHLMAGAVNVGIAQSDVIKRSVYQRFATIATLYPESVTLVVREESDIYSLQDLVGKRAYMGASGSGTEKTVRKIIDACKIDDSVKQVVQGSSSEAISRLVDGELDAFFTVLGHPAAMIRSLATKIPIRLVDLKGDCIDSLLNGENANLVNSSIPAGHYPGVKTSVQTIGAMATLVTTLDLPESIAYRLAQVLYGNLNKFRRYPEALKVLSRDSMSQEAAGNLHPGVQLYLEGGKLSQAKTHDSFLMGRPLSTMIRLQRGRMNDIFRALLASKKTGASSVYAERLAYDQLEGVRRGIAQSCLGDTLCQRFSISMEKTLLIKDQSLGALESRIERAFEVLSHGLEMRQRREAESQQDRLNMLLLSALFAFGAFLLLLVWGLVRQVRSKRELELKVQERTEAIVHAFANLGHLNEPVTGSHSDRTAYYIYFLGRAMGFDRLECLQWMQASRLHDIGKVVISTSILCKPGKLTDEEFLEIKKHPLVAQQILKGVNSNMIRRAIEIALTHHEKFDGSGYPRGLSGDDIPIWGRIAAVCDVFDALVCERPYKRPMPADKVMKILKKDRGTHFDPEAVDSFARILEDVILPAKRLLELMEALKLEGDLEGASVQKAQLKAMLT